MSWAPGCRTARLLPCGRLGASHGGRCARRRRAAYSQRSALLRHRASGLQCQCSSASLLPNRSFEVGLRGREIEERLREAMVRFCKTGLNLDDVTQERLALCEAVTRDTKQLLAGRLHGLRELELFACLDHPPVLVTDIAEHERFRLFQIQARLRFGVALRLDLTAFPSPIEDVPRCLNANTAHTAGEDAAEIDGLQSSQR